MSESSRPKDPQEQMQEFLQEQIHQMEIHKWCLGVELHHDPLQDQSLNDIYCDWIAKYATKFREEWEVAHKIEDKNGVCSPSGAGCPSGSQA